MASGDMSEGVIFHGSGSAPTRSFIVNNLFAGTSNSITGIIPNSTFAIGTEGNKPMYFMTNSVARLNILGNGNVGIGTVSPSTPLHIVPNSSGYAFRIDQGTSGDGGLIYVNTNSSARTLFSATSNASGLYVKGNGDVGIGTNSPSEELDVEGDIQVDGDYKYESVKTRYYSLSAKSFVAGDASEDLYDSQLNLIFSFFKTGSAVYSIANAGLELPDGARITKVEAYIYDNDGATSYQPRIALYRITMASATYSTIGSATLAGNSASSTPQVLSLALNSVIDNSLYAYHLKFQSTGSAGNSVRLYGVKVTYTVTQAD
jgi:hypothetical protein